MKRSNNTSPQKNLQRGNNILEEAKQKTPLQSFLEQLNDPLIFILFIAAAISMLLREFADTVIILAVIMLNAVIGVIQEGKARRALEALKKLSSPHALIKRDGMPVEIPAKDLIVGDTVYLDAGRQVPADIKLTVVSNLKIEEAALTGESLSVEKDIKDKNQAFMSTNVTYGRGEGVVIAIGMDTEIGKIARMINESQVEITPLQKRLADLGKILGIISIVLCAALFVIALLQQRNVMEMLLTAISLAVAAVPEGLPAVVTMVLAFSVSRMVKVNTIVKRLPSVETLGCVSVVCSDKTGTLTQNKMTVTACYTNGRICAVEDLDPARDRQLLEGFTLCNDGVIAEDNRVGDPTELALLDMGIKFQMHRPALERTIPRKDEIAFDSGRKMMTTLHKKGDTYVSYTKGSTEELLKRSAQILIDGKIEPFTKDRLADVDKSMRALSAKALRLLALGMKTGTAKPSEKELVFVGFVGMMDPVRPEAYEAVQTFKQAGIKTVMITGDRIDTAFAIAKDLKIANHESECMKGEEIESLTDEEFARAVRRMRVFAHVSPEHKVKIVNGLKDAGEIVAMTGDGVNDAPSLQAADVGIAMGMGGTDVAKNAADMVLTDDNFATIGKAVALGRSIYENIKKSILFLLSSNFGEIIIMLAAIAIGLSSPLRPSHILWVNLITDSLPALALGIDRNDTKNFMNQLPRPKKESLFAGGGASLTLFYGILIAFVTMTAFLQLPIGILRANHLEITTANLQMVLENPAILCQAQTYAFTVLGLSELFHAIGMRNVEKSFFKINHLSNKLMILAFFVGFGLQMLVTEVPYFIQSFGTCQLHIEEWIQLTILSAAPLLAHELLLFNPFRLLKKLHNSQKHQHNTADPVEVGTKAV